MQTGSGGGAQSKGINLAAVGETAVTIMRRMQMARQDDGARRGQVSRAGCYNRCGRAAADSQQGGNLSRIAPGDLQLDVVATKAAACPFGAGSATTLAQPLPPEMTESAARWSARQSCRR